MCGGAKGQNSRNTRRHAPLRLSMVVIDVVVVLVAVVFNDHHGHDVISKRCGPVASKGRTPSSRDPESVRSCSVWWSNFFDGFPDNSLDEFLRSSANSTSDRNMFGMLVRAARLGRERLAPGEDLASSR